MKKLVCILLMLCCALCATAESMGEYLPLYVSGAASRGGETVSMSVPEEEITDIAAQLAAMEQFSLGVGHTFLYLQQGMLIVEHTAQSAGDYCQVSYRTVDEMGNAVFEFLIEQFSQGVNTLSAVYAYENGEWLLEIR